jgi:hypothetical protein
MNESKYNLISKQEKEFFHQMFEEKRNNSREKVISFGEFKNIVMNFHKFSWQLTDEVIEVVKKGLKERQHVAIETDLAIGMVEYIIKYFFKMKKSTSIILMKFIWNIIGFQMKRTLNLVNYFIIIYLFIFR